SGFTLGPDGRVAEVHPLEVFFNGATGYEVAHMFVAAYMVTGFLVASVYAVGLLRGRRDRYTRLGFLIPFSVAAAASGLQAVVGDVAARAVLEDQPAKFAAMELITKTGPNQPETIGGVLIDGKVAWGFAIPDVASLLAGFSPSTVIAGLDQVPPDQQPPATIVHLAWNAMVGIGTLLVLLAAWFAITWWRRRDLPGNPWFLRFAAVAGIASIVAMEAGWIVTEVGRQPWIVYGFLRTSDAVTHAPGLQLSLLLTTALYVLLGVATITVLASMSRRWRKGTMSDADVPYGPPEHPTGTAS
ncbi:MAG: cytochrome ubiquinol oxidase subunit I, partial [Chloroflexota bacterium]|nr:cytochrome ubiquinol oxidase subunit I [Chloroflexota bacterium]